MSQLLTVQETADRLRCSRATVYQLARSGKLPSIRLLRGRILFDPTILADALRQSQQNPVPAGEHPAT